MLKNIGILGDSIAHGYCDENDLGWVARLGKIILSNSKDFYLFNNMSQSGDNIADTLNRAIAEVLTRKFDLIIISTGINDLRRRKSCQLQLDFSYGASIMYWNKLLDILAVTEARIVVLDLLPIIENRYTEQASLIRYNSDVEDYNQNIKNLCDKRNIMFFSRYDKWKIKDLEKLYKDATHPNSEGHQIIAEEIYDFLKSRNLI